MSRVIDGHVDLMVFSYVLGILNHYALLTITV